MNKIDITKPYRRRDGGEVELFAVRGDRIYGRLGKNSAWWNLCGSFDDPREKERFDIIQEPEKKKVKFWINIYDFGILGMINASRKEADDVADESRIACLEFEREFEVGEGIQENS